MTKIRAAYYLLLIALLMPALPDNNANKPAAPSMQSASVERSDEQSFCANHHGLCGATSYLLQKVRGKGQVSNSRAE